MATLAEVRSKYPQYNDLSDEDLAGALHQKYYSDIPIADYAAKIGLDKGTTFSLVAGSGFKGAARTAEAAGEIALDMGAGVAGDVAGALTSIATQDSKKGEAVKSALTLSPETESAKAGEAYVGDLLKPVSNVLQKPVQALQKRGHPILAQTVQAIEDVAPLHVPKALKGAGTAAREALRPVAERVAQAGEAAAAAKNAATADKSALITELRGKGLKLTSQDIGAPVGRRIEALASRPEVERTISYDNAGRSKELAAEDVGIKKALSQDSIQEAIDKTLIDYKAPRKLGRVDLAADKKFQAAMKGVEGLTAQEEADFPEAVNQSVRDEVKKYNVASADSDSMVTKIAKLREEASANFRGDASAVAKARAQRAISKAMEEAIERHGGEGSPLIGKFRAARERLAKLYTLRDAVSADGDLDLGVLARRVRRREILTGNLRLLGRAKQTFDRSFQNPPKIRSHPGGLADVGLGIAAGAAKGAVGGHLPGLVVGGAAGAARPVTRAILASAPYQRLAIRARVAQPNLLARTARSIAGPSTLDGAARAAPPTRPSTLGGGPPAAGSRREPTLGAMPQVGPRAGEPTVPAATGGASARAQPPPRVKGVDLAYQVKQPFTEKDIPRWKDNETRLTPEQRAMEDRFARAVAADYEGMKRRYAELPDTEGGKVLSVDDARELSPDYAADRSHSVAVHEPASFLIKRMYAERLLEQPKEGERPLVMFTAGGTGAGKTSSIRGNAKTASDRAQAQIIYDTNMNGLKSATDKIDLARAAGKNVAIVYVDRDPIEALTQGALPRAMRMEREKGSGRTVPVNEHAATHAGANKTIRALAERYKNNVRVQIEVVSNRGDKDAVTTIPLEKLPPLQYDKTREESEQALDRAYQAGTISERVYRGFSNPERRALVPNQGTRTAGSGRPEGSDRKGHGKELSVSTSSGRKISVRPKIIEATDLIASDHAKYPAELQPRQRGARVAMSEQVRDIASKLDPVRLGMSPKAERGAPIVGEGNVVESGNGRVFALRDVYANNPGKAEAYRQFLQDQGHDVKGFKQPVLVGERTTKLSPEERRAFTVEANQAGVSSMSPVERAQADAAHIDAGALAQLRGGDLTTVQNAPFVRSFLAKVSPSERNALVNPDGTLGQEGVRRMQGAILAKAYGGASQSNAVLGRMLESTDNEMRSALGALLDAAPSYANLKQAIADGKVDAKFDIAKPLTQAIETTAKIRDSGQAVSEYLKQGDFLSKRPPLVDELIRALYGPRGERLATRARVAQVLSQYAEQAQRQRLDQAGLFESSPLTPEKILAGLADGAAKQEPAEGELFREPLGAKPSGGDAR